MLKLGLYVLYPNTSTVTGVFVEKHCNLVFDLAEVFDLCDLRFVLHELLHELEQLLAVNRAVAVLCEVVVAVRRQKLRTDLLRPANIFTRLRAELSFAVLFEVHDAFFHAELVLV